jgi:hypothetical protein
VPHRAQTTAQLRGLPGRSTRSMQHQIHAAYLTITTTSEAMAT